MAEHPPVASLPMYDWPEVQWAHDALWSAIAERLHARGIAAPEKLDRTRPAEEVWRDPGLVLSQVCGWPFATRLRDQVQLVGTPHYDVDRCRGPYYSSVVVVRKSDPAKSFSEFRGERGAVNACDSLSGYVAFIAALNGLGGPPPPAEWVKTGSHRESVRAVADGRADIAAIDAACWALAKEFEADAASELRVLADTALRPGLPIVTASTCSQTDLNALRASLADALASDETKAARRALSLAGMSLIDLSEYEAIAKCAGIGMPQPALLPHDATDEEVFDLVRKWCDALAAEDYVQAFFMTRHRWDMTPWLLRTLTECHGWIEPLPGHAIDKVTSPATARTRPGDEKILPSNRWYVMRFEPPPHAPSYIGHVDFDLPLNGYWSDLTAQFDLNRTPEGIVLELESIHVM